MWAWPIAVTAWTWRAVAAREQAGEDRPGGRPAGAVVLAPRVAEPVEPAPSARPPRPGRDPARPSAPPARPGPARAPRPRRRSARARSARGAKAGGASAGRSGGGWRSAQPNSPLQAISTAASIRSPARARSRRRASGRRNCGPLTSPWTGSPSSHSVASELVSSSRSTGAPAHSGGTVAASRSHHVAHSGPSGMPSRASAYGSAAASAGASRSTGPAMRSPSTGRVWACTSSCTRRETCRMRSRA